MKEIWISILDFFGLAWWVEIVTENPSCTYYFGPFANPKDAQIAQPGYIEDLESEGARGIQALVKRARPGKLTVFDEAAEPQSRRGRISPIFSGQM
jgi:hypothetical protein